MDLDRIKDELARFIRWVMRDVTYHRHYPCVVQRQDGAGLLDLLPDDESIRGSGLSGVPIRHGLPGFTVKVPVGARCMLAFENGDPRKPYASLWDPGSVIGVEFDGGTRPLTFLGALVTSGGPGLLCTIMPALPGLPITTPGGLAVPVQVPCFISFGPAPIADLTTGVDCQPLYGSVSAGIDKFTG